MNKIVFGFFLVLGLAAAAFMGKNMRVPESVQIAAVVPGGSPALAGNVIGSHKPYMALAKGVQKFCLDDYEMESCLGYAVKCGEQCDSLLPKSVRVRILTDFNKYRVAKGEKPFIPPRAPASDEAEKPNSIRIQPTKSTLKSGSI